MEFEEQKAIEVGNIFKLGTKYSAPFDLKFKDKDGSEKTVIMGCYGVGPSRLMGTIVEVSHDKDGIIWPESVAPFKYHLLALGGDEKTKRQAPALGAEPRTVPQGGSGARVKKYADGVYEKLADQGVEVLYDDREMSAGAKFAEADLIGIPYRLVISEKTLEKDSVEIKRRNEKGTKLIKISEISGHNL